MRLLPWTLAVVLLSLVSIALSESRTLDPVQNLSLTLTSPIESGLRDAAEPTADFFDGLLDRGDIARENKQLREELEALKADLAAGEDAQRRVRELEEALGVKESRPEDEFVVADVIAQEPSPLKRAIAINRGSGDGLDEGMVVLSRAGSLVGTIFRVYDDFAWVRLLTDPNAAVNATVLSEGEDEAAASRGVVTGELRAALSLEMLPPDATPAEGDLVTTSGLGGNYPRALLIGTVASVETRPQATFVTGTVEPAADLSSLDTVLVISNFLPARLEGP
jgi:rod shape-determining protein MreC